METEKYQKLVEYRDYLSQRRDFLKMCAQPVPETTRGALSAYDDVIRRLEDLFPELNPARERQETSCPA